VPDILTRRTVTIDSLGPLFASLLYPSHRRHPQRPVIGLVEFVSSPEPYNCFSRCAALSPTIAGTHQFIYRHPKVSARDFSGCPDILTRRAVTINSLCPLFAVLLYPSHRRHPQRPVIGLIEFVSSPEPRNYHYSADVGAPMESLAQTQAQPYQCPQPCGRSFPSHRTLALHRTNSAPCAARFIAYISRLSRGSITRIPSNLPPLENADLRENDAVGPPDGEAIDTVQTDESVISEAIDSTQANEEPQLAHPPVEPSSSQSFEVVHGEAGRILQRKTPPFVEYSRELTSLCAPFRSQEDWELAVWMHRSGLSRSKMDAYFQLPHVCLKYYESCLRSYSSGPG